MCAVPLILERIYKSIVDTMRRQGWAVEELFHYFVNYKMKWQVRIQPKLRLILILVILTKYTD